MKPFFRVKRRIARLRPKRDSKSYLFVKNIVIRKAEGLCVYCGEKAVQVDHKIPNCYGGEDTIDNLVACCQRCNQLKGCSSYQLFCEKHPWTLSPTEQFLYAKKYKYPNKNKIRKLTQHIIRIETKKKWQRIANSNYPKCAHGITGKFCTRCRYHCGK